MGCRWDPAAAGRNAEISQGDRVVRISGEGYLTFRAAPGAASPSQLFCAVCLHAFCLAHAPLQQFRADQHWFCSLPRCRLRPCTAESSCHSWSSPSRARMLFSAPRASRKPRRLGSTGTTAHHALSITLQLGPQTFAERYPRSLVHTSTARSSPNAVEVLSQVSPRDRIRRARGRRQGAPEELAPAPPWLRPCRPRLRGKHGHLLHQLQARAGGGGARRWLQGHTRLLSRRSCAKPAPRRLPPPHLAAPDPRRRRFKSSS